MKDCDENMPVDAFMNKRCRENKSKCAAYEYPTMPRCYGAGLIQQNRIDMIGMHDETNVMRE